MTKNIACSTRSASRSRGSRWPALGSVFGHLYISGGNYSERLVGGRIAGRNAAPLEPRPTRVVERVAQPQA